MIDRPTEIVKEIIKLQKDIKIAVDMTAGNGKDTKFILDRLNPDKLYAFDIQTKARDNTLALIGDDKRFEFIEDSHVNIDKYIKDEIDLCIYNLGYLPKGDKNITTNHKSTLESLQKALSLLSKTGQIIMTVYPGHEEGAIEAKSLDEYLEELDYKKYSVIKMNFPNKINNPPYIYIIGRS